jgi:CHASE2 domain-containing sensor protein
MDIQFIILKVITGSFEAGFTVALDVETFQQRANVVQQKDFYARLPPFPQGPESRLGLDQLYGRWAGAITATRAGCAQRQRGIIITSMQAISTRYEPLPDRQHQQALKQAMVQWLTTPTPEWQALEKEVVRWLNPAQLESQVIIQLSQSLYQASPQVADILAKLPWSEWPLFAERPSPGHQPVYFAVNTYQYGRLTSPTLRPSPPLRPLPLRHYFSPTVRILHVMGHNDGINLEPDQAVLAQLAHPCPPGRWPWPKGVPAEVVSLRQPTYETLSQTLKDERGFDLFIYSGHSEAFYDQDLAAMLLAEEDGVTIADLKSAFQRAITYGLKIAIFNSCASTQLAEALLDYGISTVISMKEEVPDTVAHRFLASFFQQYVQAGQSLFQALGNSLVDLEDFDRLYPGVSWLPIIHQNPALPPPRWQELRQKPKALHHLGGLTLGVTLLSLGLHFSGLTQGLDLKLWDGLVRTQPLTTAIDERIVAITIDQNDLDILRQNGFQSPVGKDVLSDGALAAALTKIQAYQPRWLGLDIVRDLPIAPGPGASLPSVLAQSPRLLLACGFPNQQGEELLPPPDVALDNLTFINIPIDLDGVIRRQLLYYDTPETSACPARQSLAFSLALNYLAEQGILPRQDTVLAFNQRMFRPLADRPGVYRPEQVSGYQILFRSQPRGIIREISLSTLYADRQQRLDLKDKIVLVGYSHKDKHQTVYDQDIPGVVIHAQMVKQILDAVLAGQPVYGFLPAWGEGLWILFWSGLGAGGMALVIIGEGPRRQRQSLLIGLMLGVTGIAWLALWGWGLWLPLSSPLLILGLLLGDTILNQDNRHQNPLG